MSADEDTPMESVQKRLLDAARAVVNSTPNKNTSDPFFFVPARAIWDLQDVLNDIDFEIGK